MHQGAVSLVHGPLHGVRRACILDGRAGNSVAQKENIIFVLDSLQSVHGG